MKVLIAPDSFKEALDAPAVAAAIAAGVKQALPSAEVVELPIADGGEGTTQALVSATQGSLIEQSVTGPLGDQVAGFVGVLGDGNTAVVECASASGLHWVPPEQRNPWLATSYGTGELILLALEQGIRSFIIGLGGSATNDAGMGMLQALGARFYDAQHQLLARGCVALAQVAHIDLEQLDARLAQCQFRVACDVDNPFTGEHGASAVFGPQKGADAQLVKKMDAALASFAEQVKTLKGIDLNTLAGAGAAGGLGGCFAAFFNARLESGIDIVLDAVGFDQALKRADLVIAAEGRVDSQTAQGKAPAGIAARAATQGVPVVLLAGQVDASARKVNMPFAGLFSISPGVITLPEALKNTASNLTWTAEQVMALVMLNARD